MTTVLANHNGKERSFVTVARDRTHHVVMLMQRVLSNCSHAVMNDCNWRQSRGLLRFSRLSVAYSRISIYIPATKDYACFELWWRMYRTHAFLMLCICVLHMLMCTYVSSAKRRVGAYRLIEAHTLNMYTRTNTNTTAHNVTREGRTRTHTRQIPATGSHMCAMCMAMSSRRRYRQSIMTRRKPHAITTHSRKLRVRGLCAVCIG